MSDAPIFDPDTGEVLETSGDQPPVPSAMSLDEARALLVREHETAVGKDDPLLMSVTLHQGFTRDYEAMLGRHDEGIKAILGATGEACAQAVETALAGLKDKAVKANLDQAFALVTEHARTVEGLDAALRRHTRRHAVLSFISLLCTFVVLAILFSLLK